MAAPRPTGPIELADKPFAPAPPACRSCEHFGAPTSDQAKIEKVGGTWRGDCLLNPVTLKKSPDDRCGQHSLLAAQRREADAAVLGAALAHALAHAMGDR
jgi:hypothetical protein